MSAYDELRAIDLSIRKGETTLVEVLDHMRTYRLTNFTRDQLVAATAVNDLPDLPDVPEPAAPAPQPIRSKRRQ